MGEYLRITLESFSNYLYKYSKTDIVQQRMLLAFANTTKPLQRYIGLVLLANAYKSAVPRVHGWPGERLFSALSGLPRTHPPLTQIGYAR
jgi:hypothetical protein